MVELKLLENKKIKAVIFDFDGVLCTDYFYHTLEKSNPDIYCSINKIFQESEDLIKDWMRGKIDSDQFNRILAKQLKIDSSFLSKELERSIRKMKLNSDLLEFAKQLKQDGLKTAILTDHMDIFSKIIVPHFKLNQYFDKIFSSADYKLLKEDDDGKLLDIAADSLGVEPKDILVVDDSEGFCKMAEAKGYLTYVYKKGAKNFLRYN